VIVTIAAEGTVDVAAAIRLCEHVGHSVGRTFPQRGKGNLDRQLDGYRNAARFEPWLVLRDLDHDENCAPALSRRLMPVPSRYMMLRIAVRAIESWFLSDAPSFARYFGVREETIPPLPDTLPDPKRTVLDLVAGSSARSIRAAVLPGAGMTRSIGPAYSARLIDFARSVWRIESAAAVSPSLSRCVAALITLGQDHTG
jgi:hypothetical protein